MNVELVNPTLVLGLFAGRDAAGPKPGRWRAPAWPRRARARLDERPRWRRAWRGVRQLDGRALEDPDRAWSDVAAPAWRHAKGAEPPART
jgi:hypothetical protein